MTGQEPTEIEVMPGVYMTSYKKEERDEQSDILNEFLKSNDASWLRFELDKISLSVLLMEDTNIQLMDMSSEDVIYEKVCDRYRFSIKAISENEALIVEKRALIAVIEDRIKHVSTQATWVHSPSPVIENDAGVYL